MQSSWPENDYMPGVEKGINYARAAFKGNSHLD